ncbi:hypothetical protein DIPPA_28693 [Diplonema papillatum]|nr:hypothetical protein DIPPA_28693 [Diplonema papillatum]
MSGYPPPPHGYPAPPPSGDGDRYVLEAPDGTQVELSEQEALAAGGAGAEYQKEIPTEQARGMPEGSQDRGIGKLLLGAAAAGLTLYLMRGVIKKVSGKVTGKSSKKDKKGGKDKKEKKDKKGGKKDKKDKKKKKGSSSSSSSSSS